MNVNIKIPNELVASCVFYHKWWIGEGHFIRIFPNTKNLTFFFFFGFTFVHR